MTIKNLIFAALVAPFLVVLAGCDLVLPPPENPDPPFTKNEVLAIEKCQKAINKMGRNLVKEGQRRFEECLTPTLATQLRYESEHLTMAQFDSRLEQDRGACYAAFGRYGRATTDFVDGVVTACETAAPWVLGPADPLQFLAWWGEMNGTSVGGASLGTTDIATVEDLAGFLCAVKTVAIDSLVGVQFPRKCYILETLGPEFGDSDGEFCWPLVDLDWRCDNFLENGDL